MPKQSPGISGDCFVAKNAPRNDRLWSLSLSIERILFFSTIALVFGLLHAFLFLYNRRLRSHLYFAIFLILYAMSIFSDFQASMAQESAGELLFLRIHRLMMKLSSIFHQIEDTVFTITDRFPALFDENKETLDYWRVKEIFQRSANQTAFQIVRDLLLEVDKWRNGFPQNDDITFIVLKVPGN